MIVLEVLVDDLDNDRISSKGFDIFSFTWQAVSELLAGGDRNSGESRAEGDNRQ